VKKGKKKAKEVSSASGNPENLIGQKLSKRTGGPDSVPRTRLDLKENQGFASWGFLGCPSGGGGGKATKTQSIECRPAWSQFKKEKKDENEILHFRREATGKGEWGTSKRKQVGKKTYRGSKVRRMKRAE